MMFFRKCVIWFLYVFLSGSLMAQANTIAINNNAYFVGPAKTITWIDSQGGQRTIYINRYKGHITRYVYDISCDMLFDFSLGGMNVVVTHYSGGSYFSSKANGTQFRFTDVFEGEYHALHRVSFNLPHHDRATGNNTPDMIGVTFDYMVTTGQDYFIIAYTWDTSKLPPLDGSDNRYDTRSPYNEIDWNGNGSRDGEQVIANWQSGTDCILTFEDLVTGYWTKTFNNNIVTFVREWDATGNREMGMVSTENYKDKPMGKEWSNATTRNITDMKGYSPPGDPFQFTVYQQLRGERITWGSQNVIGKNSAVYGGMNLDGYPFYNYSVMMVLDEYSDNKVITLVEEQERYNNTYITSISGGQVITQGPGGPGDSTMVTWQKAGYNPVYRTWEVWSDTNYVDFRFRADKIKNPTFVVNNYASSSCPDLVTVNTIKSGTGLENGTDYFASLDSDRKKLYLTFNSEFDGDNDILISASFIHIDKPDKKESYMTLNKGWSMISLPVEFEDPASGNVLLQNSLVIYGGEKGASYKRIESANELEVGKGYWILSDQNQTLALTGKTIQSYTLTVVEDGWIMIGGCTFPAEALIDNCNINVIYGYDPKVGYKRLPPGEKLQPKKGYWILLEDVTGQCTLTVETN